MTEPLPLLAWDVAVYDMHCIVFATTAPKARWKAVKSYWEAFDRRGWPTTKAVRKPVYDDCPLRSRQDQRAWTEGYVSSCMV